MTKGERDRKRMVDAGTVFLKKTAKKPAPAAQGAACLIYLYPPGPNIGRRTPLVRDEYIVGRVAEVDVVIERDSVSRRHARLFRDGGGMWTVQDMGSTNGTFVNEERLDGTGMQLRDNDQVRIGDAIFKFLAGTNVEASYHEEIYRMTILDGLTQVHNKRYFLEFAERELARSLRHGHPLTLVMFDIDHFKQINDTRGHLCGDAVLRGLSDRLRPRMRREDLLARYGGEEFAALLTVTDLHGGLLFAEALRARIADTPFEFEGERFPVTISLGAACVHGERDMTVLELIRRADEKLYEAKRAGRNRVEA